MSKTEQDSGEPASPVHRPVLLREVLQHLDLKPGLTVADATVGAGGHSRKILEKIGPTGTLIGLDRDPMMLGLAARSLAGPQCILRHAGYTQLREVLDHQGIQSVDRVLLDLGVSSDQLADDRRGFGFTSTGPLDMRFDPTSGRPAYEVIEELNEHELERIFREFGEERFSRRIAEELVRRRAARPVRTAADLVDAVEASVPVAFQRQARRHPATRVFQALRIAVNDELGLLERALRETLYDCLTPGGRAVVITFHSLEDRLVKEEFRNKRWQNLTPKPVTATAVQQRINPRSRSAKLRAARKR